MEKKRQCNIAGIVQRGVGAQVMETDLTDAMLVQASVHPHQHQYLSEGPTASIRLCVTRLSDAYD